MSRLVQLTYDTVYAMVYESGVRELPAERLLAEQIGVSRGILRKALQQLTAEGHLAPADGRRRRATAAELKPARNQLIGLVYKSGVKTQAEMIAHKLSRRWYQAVEICMRRAEREYTALNALPFQTLPLDGVIAIATWEIPITDWLEQFPCPIVLLDHSSRSRRIVDLLPDELNSCRRFCRRLVNHGGTKVFYFDFHAEDVNPMRWEAFVSATTEFDLTIEGRVTVPLDGQQSLEKVRGVLSKLERGTGLFCASDSAGSQLASVMQTTGMRSPDDFYVIMPGGKVMFPGRVRATGYELDWERACTIACDLMENLLSGKVVSRKKRLLPMMIIEGGTL